VLNIGLLAPGAGEYYIGEVASSAEDYYTGQGESAGRWVGSLAKEIGLKGEVDPDDFRAVLAGRDPQTGEQHVHRPGPRSSGVANVDPEREFDAIQAASVLDVSARHVRRLLEEGDRYLEQRGRADGEHDLPAPKGYLSGTRVAVKDQQGPEEWRVKGSELQRFAESRTERKFRPGYDLTLRPPKSVSVLWALGGPDIAGKVRDAHTAAVDQVVRYYEHQAVRSRSTKTGRRVETDGIIAAAFDHRTSRAGDPLLHTHVVTANMTRFRDSDRKVMWRAIESPGLFEHAKAAGCLYQAHLRHELTKHLGVRFRPVANGYAEIDGVPDAVIDVFSKRRNEIEEELAATGRTTARSAQVATLETRKAKDYSVDADTLTARWLAEAASVGFDTAAARACTGISAVTTLTDADAERILGLLAGPHGLCERASTFRRSDVVETISTLVGSSATGAQIRELAERFVTSTRVVAVSPSGVVRPDQRRSAQQRWTTVDLANTEKRLLVQAERRVVSPDHRIGNDVVADVVATRPELSDEQARMVDAVCRSDRFVLPVEGRPGAGKTYATEAIVAAHVEAGVPILGCAISAAAASELETQAGFARSAMAATTVAKLLHDLDRFGGLAAGTTVVVDEASMIGTRDLARLADHAERVAGRMILVGDPDQHGSVDAGGVFARLCRERGDDPVKLVENRRQDDHVDRLAIEDYRNGLVADAVQRLDDADRVVRSATAGESFDAMVADWYAARLAGAADPMIAGPNSTRRALNERARVLLKASGELTGTPLRVAGREFQRGDEVVARRNDRTLRAPGSKDFVKNGSVGVIEQVHHRDHEVTVNFEREGMIRVPRAYLAAGRLEHGYARTTYGVQGHTHDVARYHPTDASGFEEGYVAVTRGRKGARLYVVDGTVGVDQDAHHSRETERHTLDDITDAFGRRRANTMAADLNPSLDRVADLAQNRTLAELHQRRRDLDRQLASAPPDTTAIIDESTRARDALLVRRRTLQDTATEAVPAELQRRIDHLERRIANATRQQAEREAWLTDHRSVVEERQVVGDAERAVAARIRHRPLVHLPAHVIAALGPEPDLQRERSAWSAAASATAIHRERHNIPAGAGDGLDGPAALLGERPADALAAASWDYAAAKVADIDVEQAIESGTGL
jgi:conjugative relaxase-like TrwC/TraI family protein